MSLAEWISTTYPATFPDGVRLTTALLHFLWIGTLIGLASALVGTVLYRASARARYLVHLTALVAMGAALPAIYAGIPGRSATVSLPVPESVVVVEGEAPYRSPAANEWEMPRVEIFGPATVAPLEFSQPAIPSAAETGWLEVLSPSVTLAYLLGVLCMLARLGLGLWGGRRLRAGARPVEDGALLEMLARQSRRVGLAFQPGLAWCERVAAPVVIGLLKPTILLPAALACGIETRLVESLVAHELAHIRRWDLAVNLLQRLIEAALFFHPAVWFVSARVSAERENACDDLVLAAGCPRLQYAEALVQMAEWATRNGSPRFGRAANLVAATGESRSQFKRRVLRVLGHDPSPKLGWSRGMAAGCLLAAGLLVAAPLVVPAGDRDSESPVASDENPAETPATESPVAESPTPPAVEVAPPVNLDPIDEQLALLAESPWEEDRQLNDELRALDQMRGGEPAEIERRGAALLQRFTEEPAQGRIYYQLAHVFGQKNIRDHALPVKKNAALALERDHNPQRRAMAQGYLGSAAILDPMVADPLERRRNAVRWWIEVYKDLLPLKLPKNAPDLPGIGKISDEPGQSEARREENRRIQSEQMRARTKAQFVRELVLHRQIAARQAVELYRSNPPDDAELQRIARDILGDSGTVQALLKEGIALRVGEDRPEIAWIGKAPDSPSGLTVEIIPGSQVERTPGGLKLSIRIANRSPHDLTATLAHEVHGGEWPATQLYAMVTPLTRVRDVKFQPAYLFGERDVPAAESVTIEAGRSRDLDIRLDWAGTDSVKASRLLPPTMAGEFRVRFALAFESHNGLQYVVSPTAIVALDELPLEEKLQTKVSLKVLNRPLLFVLDELEQAYRVPVTVSLKEMGERKVDPQMPITLDEQGVTLRQLFEKIALLAELDVEFTEKGVRIPAEAKRVENAPERPDGEDETSQVVDAQGKPIAGATVLLLPFNAVHSMPGSDTEKLLGALPTIATTTTDADGRFRYPPETPELGNYFFIRFSAPGFLTQQMDGNQEVHLRRDGKLIPDRVLLRRAATLAGQVLGPGGARLQGVPLAFRHFSSVSNADYFSQTRETDADGRFRLEGVPAGQWSIVYSRRLDKRGRVPEPTRFGVIDVETQEGATIDDITLDLGQSLCRVEGELIDPRKNGLARANVWAQPFGNLHPAADFWIETKTDELGRFRLDGLPPAKFRIRASRPPVGMGEPVEVQLRPEQVTPVTLLSYYTGQAPPADRKQEPNWGPTQAGLQAALVFGPAKERYAIGETLVAWPVVRNVSGRTQELVDTALFNSLRVVNAPRKEVRIKSDSPSQVPWSHTYVLEPGQEVRLDGIRVQLMGKQTAKERFVAPLSVTPGAEMILALSFGDALSIGKQVDPEEDRLTWKTGTTTLQIAE